MAKRTTKAEIILQEARRKVEIAEGNVQVSLLQLREHEASLIAYREVYDSLAEMLAPSPRKASVPKSTTVPSAGKRSPRSKSAGSSTANTEVETASVLSAGASGD